MPEPLADTDALAARLGVTFTSAEEDRAAALLADASAAVRNYTRQTISFVTDDTAILEATREQWLYLPERPVRSVSAVVAGGATLADGYWRVQNDALFRQHGWNTRFYGSAQPWNQPETIVVTYSHGYDEIPDDIIRVVCKLAGASWLNPQGYRSATVGGVSITLATETIGVGALDDDDKRILDDYRRPRRSVTLSAGLM